MNKTAKLGLISVASFVIANMIGAGVFTSLGYQLQSINNPYSILMLWVVGGVLALCGALVYGELGAAMPRSGGEYHYLGKIYHPVLGFLSGWVSLTVGFAAPVALSSMGAGRYLSMVFPELSQTWTALTVLTIVTAIHCYTIQFGGKFQTLFTSINIGLILIFIFAGCLYTPQVQNTAAFASAIDWNEMISPAFAVSLIYVSFAYSGWNAAAYIAGDIDNPRHTLPRSLFISTMVVMVLYVMLNLVFMLTAPIAEMKGQMEIGFISATHLFGISGGRITVSYTHLDVYKRQVCM